MAPNVPATGGHFLASYLTPVWTVLHPWGLAAGARLACRIVDVLTGAVLSGLFGFWCYAFPPPTKSARGAVRDKSGIVNKESPFSFSFFQGYSSSHQDLNIFLFPLFGRRDGLLFQEGKKTSLHKSSSHPCSLTGLRRLSTHA